MNRKPFITIKDFHRYKVLQDVIDKKLKGDEASEILGLSYVHISRLKAKLVKGGFENILRKILSSSPNKRTTDLVISEIIKLRKEIYYDFNIMHFMEKLEENHNIRLSYESLRQILIQNTLP